MKSVIAAVVSTIFVALLASMLDDHMQVKANTRYRQENKVIMVKVLDKLNDNRDSLARIEEREKFLIKKYYDDESKKN